ncbi:MAG: 6-carboxy-5,6,7,8-tetrahydropterin synthase [Lentisphaerae bacterium ADurb.BinA184]|nr:MAG: 6-carboxy-5,6,7,8-tetrahydropterin synthase [Lentisphaerae bacterium ADurb.BinA184]
MFEVHVKAQFSAAHRLANYPGNCSRWHGHNWEVTLYLEARELNALGIALDFREIKRHLGELLAALDHADLNAIPELASLNPTSEVIARHLFRQAAARFNDGNLRVSRITVCETPGTGASFWE